MDPPLLQAITDGSNEAIAVIDIRQSVIYVNGRFCILFGIRPSDIIGKPLNSLNDLTPIVNRITSDMESRREYPSRSIINFTEKELNHHDSYLVHLDYVTISGAIYCIIRLNESLPNRSSVLQSELDFAWILESLMDGVVIVNEKGEFQYANTAFCEMLNRTSDELIGKRWVDFTSYPDDDIIYEKVALRRAGEAERYEIEWTRPDSTFLSTYVSAAPYYDRNGSFKGSIGVVTDITELKEHESALKFYINLLTHDIPNQLQVVLTAAGLLDAELPSSYIDEARVTITEAIERCNRLIVKVKRAAKMRDLPIREIDISQVLKEKIRVVERVYQAKVHLDSFEDSIRVLANTLLGELIWNLLENAACHNPKTDRHIWIRGQVVNEYFSISIEDNGPGISDAKKEILFDSTRRTGGVGLTLVDRMVRECGGWIEVHDRVEGRPDQGSKFIMYLPLAE
ncbi:MAG: PAS domain S-box protein [Candidatus Thorarchaeota archaeon]